MSLYNYLINQSRKPKGNVEEAIKKMVIQNNMKLIIEHGNMTLSTAFMADFMLFITSYIFSIKTGMQYEQSYSVWDAMTVYFINNASANMFHVVFPDGTESQPVMRIAIGQVIMFTIVLIRYFSWKRQIKI
jgi:hypothetical protein